MSDDTCSGCMPEAMDHARAAMNALHALWIAHQQLCRHHEQRSEPSKAWCEASADIIGALLPQTIVDDERAEDAIDAVLDLLHEMRLQAAVPRALRGCAWPPPCAAQQDGGV
ncbi:MAG TPA: hypothetical protein VFN67_33785 [Polyangiales bacterium]|nr:hypothetical protein [Polyangiales bacterium]